MRATRLIPPVIRQDGGNGMSGLQTESHPANDVTPADGCCLYPHEI